jgi:hypothetical protein
MLHVLLGVEAVVGLAKARVNDGSVELVESNHSQVVCKWILEALEGSQHPREARKKGTRTN